MLDRRMPRRTIQVVFLVLLCVVRCELAAQPTPADPPPPMARPATVSVLRGETTRIPLRAAGRAAASAKFLIRSQPAAGELSEVLEVSPGFGVVTYRHHGGGGEWDSFTFAVQAPDSPVSAPARLLIRIEDRPPDFQVQPRQVDFGEILSGETTERAVLIANRGGGTVFGTISVSDGWEILSGPDYVLSAGGSTNVALRFAPPEARDYSGTLTFSHAPEKSAELKGRAVQPLQIRPLSVELQPLPQDPVPTARLRLRNRTAAAIAIELRADPGIIVESRLDVPAGGESQVLLRAAADHPGGASGGIELVWAEGSASIPFRLFPLPARIEIDPVVVDFGAVEAGQTGAATVTLHNRGGVDARVRLDLPAGFSVKEGTTLKIPALGQSEIEIEFNAMEPGEVRAEGNLAGVGDGLRLPMTVRVVGGVGGPTRSLPRLVFTEQEETIDPAPATEELPGPAFEVLRLLEQTTGSLWIAWEDPTEKLVAHRIERRVVGVGPDGRATIDWLPLVRVAAPANANREFRAHLRRLPPNSRFVVRLLTEGPDGAVLAVSGPFVLTTAIQPHRSQFPKILFAVAIIAGTAVMIFWNRAARRRLYAQDLARLREIEENK